MSRSLLDDLGKWETIDPYDLSLGFLEPLGLVKRIGQFRVVQRWVQYLVWELFYKRRVDLKTSQHTDSSEVAIFRKIAETPALLDAVIGGIQLGMRTMDVCTMVQDWQP